jgi:hypothetical protein
VALLTVACPSEDKGDGADGSRQAHAGNLFPHCQHSSLGSCQGGVHVAAAQTEEGGAVAQGQVLLAQPTQEVDHASPARKLPKSDQPAALIIHNELVIKQTDALVEHLVQQGHVLRLSLVGVAEEGIGAVRQESANLDTQRTG